MVVGVVVDDRIFFLVSADFITDFLHRFATDNYQACLIKSVRNEFVGRFLLKSVGVKHDKFTMYYIYKCVFQCIHVCK